MPEINWQQTREVYEHPDYGTIVRVPGRLGWSAGWMELSDYCEGGRSTIVDPRFFQEECKFLGIFSNAQISNM